MIQLDNNSTCKSLIHVCFMSNAQTGSGHLARTFAPHICCTDAVADITTNFDWPFKNLYNQTPSSHSLWTQSL